MNYLDANMNVRTAIELIRTNKIYPVLQHEGRFYLFNTAIVYRGEMLYTVFNSLGDAETSYSARYGAHHTVLQVILNPIPRHEVELVETALPENPEELSISQVLAGYIDN